MFGFRFSHVEPSGDNRAVQMLAEEVQMRNVRKVKVNAQVTFIIYILETAANFSIFVVWLFVHGSSSEVTVTMGVMWFHVVLPYIFLMNTSHNKNLLIDDGWLNTFKNAVGISIHPNNESANCQAVPLSILSTSGKNASETAGSHQDQEDKKDKGKQGSGRDKWLHRRRRPRKRKRRNSENSDIFIVSIDENTPHCSTSTLCYESTKASGSAIVGSETSQLHKHQDNLITKETSDSDEENQPPPKSYHLELGQSLLCNMFKYIRNEDGYRHYLTQLSQLEDEFNKTESFSEHNNSFQIIDYPSRKKGKVKHSTVYNNKEEQSKPERTSTLISSKNATPTELNVELVGEVFDRMETRKNLLINFPEYCNDEDSYKAFCDMLFDFEESLICD